MMKDMCGIEQHEKGNRWVLMSRLGRNVGISQYSQSITRSSTRKETMVLQCDVTPSG
jgi:hypothetical protein